MHTAHENKGAVFILKNAVMTWHVRHEVAQCLKNMT